MDKQQATEFILRALEAGKSRETIAQELSRELNAPLATVQKFVERVRLPPPAASLPKEAEGIPEPVAPQPAPARPEASRQPGLNDPELTRYVISQLKKQRKSSDLIYEICERTGAEWSQAQRFVRQVAVEQRQSISFRKNSWLVLFGGAFILVGLFFTIGGVVSLLTMLNISVGPLSQYASGDGGLNALFLGIVLLLGGMIGVYLAIQDQLR